MPKGVPYFSQWHTPVQTSAILAGADPCEDLAWRNSGFKNPNEYRFWAKRLCGLACLRSILSDRNLNVPTEYDLLQDAIEHGVYKLENDGSVLGLIYRPFCKWVGARFGLKARYFEQTELLDALTHRGCSEFLMLSVSPNIRQPELIRPPRGGHLVLVVDHDQASVTFHNPSGVPPNHADVSLKQANFERFYAKRGIHIQ